MAITLKNVASGYNLSVINENFQALQTALNGSVVWRKGSTAGEAVMLRDLDMNGHTILNADLNTSNITNDRAIRVPVNEGSIDPLPDANTRKGKVLGFSPVDGLPTVFIPASGSAADVLMQLAAPGGVSLVNGAASTSDLDELETSVNNQLGAYATPEQYSSLVVAGDWTAAINAAFATGLPVMGKGTYNVTGILNTKGQKIIGEFKINTSRYSLGTVNAKTESPDSKSIRMLYLESAYDLAELLYIKGLGFNTINHYCYFANNGAIDAAGTAEQLLDNALTAGLQVNLGTESPRAISDLSEFVNATKNHPAVFGYSVYDEPATRGFTVTQQDDRITALRALTAKPLSFVDLLVDQPFNQKFSTNYDIAFVDSYSLRYTTGTLADWLNKDLAKMRYDFGGVKAMVGVNRVIPVVSAFLDTGATPFYSNNETQVIAASKIFGKVAEGNFGAFVWDGVSGSFPGTVRTNANFRTLVKDLASQPVRKKLNTDVYLFGGTATNTIWPLESILRTLPQKDSSTTDGYAGDKAFPVRVLAGASDTDRVVTIPGADYSGIGFKGAFASLVTNIKARKNQRILLEYFNIAGTTNGSFNLYSTNDAGYTISLRYADGLSGNKILDFSNVMPDASVNDWLIFRILNTGDTSVVYRKFLRGLVVCADW